MKKALLFFIACVFTCLMLASHAFSTEVVYIDCDGDGIAETGIHVDTKTK